MPTLTQTAPAMEIANNSNTPSAPLLKPRLAE
jgi:hypothetical protein